MRAIKRLAKQIACEVKQAECYAKDALEHKSTRPALADMYYKMGSTALECASNLHNSAQKLVAEQKENGIEPPEFMLDKWEKDHSKAIEDMAMVRIYLDMYR